MQRFCPRGAIPFHQLSWWLGLSAVNYGEIYKQISNMNVKKYGIVGKLVYTQRLTISSDILRDVNIVYNDEIESKEIHLRKLETNVVDFCILFCKGCSHFSNLFDKGDAVGYESFEKDIIFLSEKERLNEQPGVVAHAFNPSTWEAEAGGFLSSRPAWSTK